MVPATVTMSEPVIGAFVSVNVVALPVPVNWSTYGVTVGTAILPWYDKVTE